jgi:hypothetical protein
VDEDIEDAEASLGDQSEEDDELPANPYQDLQNGNLPPPIIQ